MKYNIVVIGDVHWGAMKASELLFQYQYFLTFLERFPEKIDLVVNVGDATDDKLALSSKSSQYYSSTLLQQLEIGKRKGFKSRYVVGTKSHENGQYEVFKELEDDTFKIMRYAMVEETLPGLKCLYCPDENINTKEYMKHNSRLFLDDECDIMFFHGTFDKVRGNIMEQNESQELPNIIFKYDYFSKICRLMIGGHWHDSDHFKHLYYTRSYTRWAYEEDKKKGFVFISYDTDTKEYFLHRIENPFAPNYYTYHCNTILMKSIEQYIDFANKVKKVLEKEPSCHVKILFVIEEEMNEIINAGLTLIKDTFFKEKNAEIDIRNEFHQKNKEEKIIARKKMNKKFSFLKNANISYAEKIRRYILEVDNEDIPIEYIENMLYRIQNKKKEKE